MEQEKGANYLIEGNIGAGKSTFLNRLKALNLNITIVQEPVQTWTNYLGHNYLQLFYNDTQKWTFLFQQLAINTSANDYVKQQSNNSLKFFERSIFSPLKVFSQHQFNQGSMSEPEFDLHQKITYDLVQWVNYDIKGIIYVRTTPEVAQKRIQLRSRKEDATLPIDYLESLHQLHDDWLGKDCSYPVLTYENDTTITLNNFEKVEREIFNWVNKPEHKHLDPASL